jgi:hypothetical protein
LTLNLLWLAATVAQAALLAAYWRGTRWRYRWWCIALVPGIVFSPVIAALPSPSVAQYSTWVAYQIIRAVLNFVAVWELRDALTADASAKRFGTRLGLLFAAGVFAYRFLGSTAMPHRAVLAAIQGLSAVFFCTLLAVVVWRRAHVWPLAYPDGRHVALVMALVFIDAVSSRKTEELRLACVTAVQTLGAVGIIRRGKASPPSPVAAT